MRPLPPVSVVELFPRERASLLSVLGALSESEWSAPTACAGWSVHDVALHLLGDDVGILSRERDGHVDQSGSEGLDLSQWEQLLAYINSRNAEWVTATRRISPRLLCEMLAFTGERVYQHFAGCDLGALGGAVSWAGPGPAPVWLHVAREYTERWMHQQHIRDAVGRPGMKEPRWFAPVLATFVRALPHTLRTVAAPNGTSLKLAITGPAGGEWYVVRQDEGWQLTADAVAAPEATVAIDQEMAWRLFTKGLTKEAALPHVTQEGDARLTGRVLEMVSIIA
ncbi:MAG TPA: maleylpyruvate isomerase family mycothiol-dependent enzyme [Chloroflexota bacterium]|nr:maleylpyruvate isomerase family mycothiol-dependent enzyme [Chloroflexota bacterium]